MVLNKAVKKAFSDVLTTHRKKNGLSKTKLAEKSGLHRNEIGLLERMDRSPSLETFIKIAKGLEVDEVEFMNEFFEKLKLLRAKS